MIYNINLFVFFHFMVTVCPDDCSGLYQIINMAFHVIYSWIVNFKRLCIPWKSDLFSLYLCIYSNIILFVDRNPVRHDLLLKRPLVSLFKTLRVRITVPVDIYLCTDSRYLRCKCLFHTLHGLVWVRFERELLVVLIHQVFKDSVALDVLRLLYKINSSISFHFIIYCFA